MRRVRDLIASATDPSSYDRPGSLYAAGAVGQGAVTIPRREVRPDAIESDIDPTRAGRREAARPAPGDRPVRDVPGTTVAPPGRDARTDLMAALQSPATLRTAILLREILDTPVALRDSPRQR